MIIEANVGLTDLALAVANDDSNSSHDIALEFILDIDLLVCDYDFTTKLINRLQKGLDEDNAISNGEAK